MLGKNVAMKVMLNAITNALMANKTRFKIMFYNVRIKSAQGFTDSF